MVKFEPSIFKILAEAKLPVMKKVKISELPKEIQQYAKDLLRISDGKILYSPDDMEIFDVSIEFPDNKLPKNKKYIQVVK